VRLKGLGELKNLSISSGIEPATFRVVAQCLKTLCYYVPQDIYTCRTFQSTVENFQVPSEEQNGLTKDGCSLASNAGYKKGLRTMKAGSALPRILSS
jgi:hypothetical protein